MKAFITGGAGFIGRNLAEFLAKNGHQVTIYDKSPADSISNTKFVEGNILDFEKLCEAMRGHDFVFHLAAHSVVYSNIGPDVFIEQNIIGTKKVLEAMEKNNITKIAFASSQAVYGLLEKPASEEAPTMPVSYYGMSKLACEALINSYCQNKNWQVWIFRLANITGARQTHGVIYDFIKKLKTDGSTMQVLGDGAQKKCYVLIDECINAIMFAIKQTTEKVSVLNIGSYETIAVIKIAKIVAEELKLKPKFIFESTKTGWPGDQYAITLDTRKLNTLGWHSRYSQEETIRLSVQQILKT